MDFSPFAAVLLDLDGTIYQDDHALPGAIEMVQRIAAAGHKFACLTNGTSSPQRYQKRLAAMGVTIDAHHIYTAAAAAADYVLLHAPGPGKPRVYNLATEGITELLDGKVIWVGGIGQPCDFVISGTMTNTWATEDRQLAALDLLRHGAGLIGICADRVYPSPRGIEFGSGAFTHMLGYAAEVTPIFTGKPERVFFEELCARLGVRPEKCILIGDNLESDIFGAKRMGMKTILTLTGVTRRTDLATAPQERTPDMVVEGLAEL